MIIKYNKHQKTETVWDQKTRCDFCQKDIPQPRLYERSEVTISAVIGDSYPEDDASRTYEIDCCVPCFMKRVKPALEEKFGAKFRERFTDDYRSAAYAVEEP